jgi:hypothetical protein
MDQQLKLQNQINFREIDGHIVQVSEYNTLITYYRTDGKVAVVDTIKAHYRFRIAQFLKRKQRSIWISMRELQTILKTVPTA